MTRPCTTDDPRIPSVYVVAWPDGVWKVGYSGTHRRWAKFIRTGGTLVDLFEFREEVSARRFEGLLLAAFRTFSTPAYTWPAPQAQWRMGSHHAIGYTECVRIDPEVLVEDWFRPGVHEDHLGVADGWHIACASTFLRAYKLTHHHLPWLGEICWTERKDIPRGRTLPILKSNMWRVA